MEEEEGGKAKRKTASAPENRGVSGCWEGRQSWDPARGAARGSHGCWVRGVFTFLPAICCGGGSCSNTLSSPGTLLQINKCTARGKVIRNSSAFLRLARRGGARASPRPSAALSALLPPAQPEPVAQDKCPQPGWCPLGWSRERSQPPSRPAGDSCLQPGSAGSNPAAAQPFGYGMTSRFGGIIHTRVGDTEMLPISSSSWAGRSRASVYR